MNSLGTAGFCAILAGFTLRHAGFQGAYVLHLALHNTDYVIYMTTPGGRTWRWFKDDTGWKQVGPEGQTHHPTAEQVLNHLLPACAGIKPITLKVVYRPLQARKTGKEKWKVDGSSRTSAL